MLYHVDSFENILQVNSGKTDYESLSLNVKDCFDIENIFNAKGEIDEFIIGKILQLNAIYI